MLDRLPSNVYIICTTTESYKILRTIKSRATIWDFKLLGEKQLSQLLDDYLKIKGVDLEASSKVALLKSANGVPRDLLKNIDLALAGDFSGEQLNELLGRVSEDLFFSILCALKSQSVDFAIAMSSLLDGTGRDVLSQFRDFYTRFLLERKGLDNPTVGKDRIVTLLTMYTPKELEKIGRVLVKATPDTLMLELSLLNMELTNTTFKKMTGQQIDKSSRNQAQNDTNIVSKSVAEKRNAAQLNRTSIKNMFFGEDD